MQQPIQQTKLETLWEASRAGLVDWASVQQHQADMMPRCKAHPERPAPAMWASDPICAECAEAIAKARKEQGNVR